MVAERYGSLVIDRDSRQVTLDGEIVSLTRSEYALLVALAAEPRRALSRRSLLESMWGGDWQADTTPLQVHVSRLRRKLGESGHAPRHVVTVHGFGYRFEPEPGPVPTDASSAYGLEQLEADSLASTQVYVVLNRDRTITFASSNVEQLVGWHPEELYGMHLFDLGYLDDPESTDMVTSELDSGKPTGVLIHLRTPDGTYRLIDAFVRPIVGAGNGVTGFLAEWRLFRTGLPPRAVEPPEGAEPIVLASATTPVDDPRAHSRMVTLTFDRDLRLQAIDPVGPVLGWEPDEVLGTYFSPTGAPADAVQDVLISLLRAGTTRLDAVVELPTKHGPVVTRRVVNTILVDDSGQMSGLTLDLYLPED